MLEDSGDAEITDFDLTTWSHEDILRLEITMKNFTVVDVLDC